MSKQEPENDPNLVTIHMVEAFTESLRLLTASSERLAIAMKESKVESFRSSNYPTALRGMKYVVNFISGGHGAKETAAASKLLGLTEEQKEIQSVDAKRETSLSLNGHKKRGRKPKLKPE